METQMDTTRLATVLAAGRIAVGSAILAAPALFLRGWVGETASEPGGRALGRAVGVRDLALGAATLGAIRATGTSGTGSRVLIGLGVACDAVDALTTLEHRGRMGPMAGGVVALAGGAAALGIALLVTASGPDPDPDVPADETVLTLP